jgi:radical SAM-linked protein
VGQYVPNNAKVQRLRLWFGKLGDMALVSHLDLMRLFDRAVRRAALPVSFTAGFSPSPRISVALALPLGVTSSGEIVDFELTQSVDPATFQQQLSRQLPADIPIYKAIALDLKAPAAMKTLSGAEYILTIATTQTATLTQWQEWVETIKNSNEIWWEQTTKSKKTYQVNLRDRLFELELVARHNPATGGSNNSTVNLRYVGSCSQDGSHLKPEHLTFMLEQVAHQEIQLLHIHRQRLIL